MIFSVFRKSYCMKRGRKDGKRKKHRNIRLSVGKQYERLGNLLNINLTHILYNCNLSYYSII
jgi:hypothetical protein